ncbi:MAG: DNA-directed RNA polymerase subunit D [Candidatus Micrarchaeia archaeon]
MKLTVKKSDASEVEFELSDASFSFANALRRTAMARVPVYAIDSVTFYENSSSLFDEYIASRIGLVPLTTPSEAKEGDLVLFTLDAEGPCTVFSKDLKSSEKGVAPVSDRIPLLKLLAGQRLRLEARARLGSGSEHAKFQAGIAAYSFDRKKEAFHFRIESFGQVPAPKLVEKSVAMLLGKCEELLEALAE